MNIFALNEISEIDGKLKVFKLLVNGKCEYDEFETQIKTEGNLVSELNTIETRLHEMADLKSFPETKFKELKPKNANTEYEIKTKNLRVYLFHEKNTGRVVVCGGKKNSQKSDIRHFRKVKEEYFAQKK